MRHSSARSKPTRCGTTTSNDFVKVGDPQQVESFIWHEIPAETVNAKGTVRLLTSGEWHELSVFGVDAEV